MYADAHGGRFPSGEVTPIESLWLLYPKYVTDPRIFLNPNERLNLPETDPITNDLHQSRIKSEFLTATGFVYVEGIGDDGATDIVFFERVSNRGGRLVAHGAGIIEWMSEPEFQKRLILERSQRTIKSLNAAPAPATPPFSNP